jgi:signal transduction histidine kinase
MAVSQRTRTRRLTRKPRPGRAIPTPVLASVAAVRVRPLTSPGQIAVIYRWASWALALGLIVTGSTAVYGAQWQRHGDVFVLLGLTLVVNLLLTFGLRPYMRLMRRYPPVLALDVLFCLGIYARSNIWSSPFQFYSYSALMLPVAIFLFSGALVGSALFLALNLALLYGAGNTFIWAQSTGVSDTYLMQLAIVPLLAFVFAYPNWLYTQLRRAQQRLDEVERERLLEAERTRIAHSLHDSVAQMLFGIRMLSESALARLSEHGTSDRAPIGGTDTADAAPLDGRAPLADVLRQVRELAAKGNHEMRRAIYALNEPSPSRQGLAISLKAMLADLATRAHVETHLEVRDKATADHGKAGPPAAGGGGQDATSDELPEPVAEAMYKVTREALANVEKHAEARNVWVELRVERARRAEGPRYAVLSVRDDGHGFQRPLLAQPGEPDEDDLGVMHFGLGNMRRAVESVGGRLEVNTSVGHGTHITASVPIM